MFLIFHTRISSVEVFGVIKPLKKSHALILNSQSKIAKYKG